jgi:nucleoside-diphosphate-sugar epimerase
MAGLLLGVLLLAGAPGAAALRIGVTGAHGFLGNEVVWQAAVQGHQVRAIVRDAASARSLLPPDVEIFEAKDLTDPGAAAAAAAGLGAVIHTASVFRRCENMETELVQPNIVLVENMVKACASAGARLVLTSSMAAIRGAGQEPKGACFTTADWNTASRRDGAGFEPYQYSKMESERVGWELAKECGVEMVSLCPPVSLFPAFVLLG